MDARTPHDPGQYNKYTQYDRSYQDSSNPHWCPPHGHRSIHDATGDLYGSGANSHASFDRLPASMSPPQATELPRHSVKNYHQGHNKFPEQIHYPKVQGGHLNAAMGEYPRDHYYAKHMPNTVSYQSGLVQFRESYVRERNADGQYRQSSSVDLTASVATSQGRGDKSGKSKHESYSNPQYSSNRNDTRGSEYGAGRHGEHVSTGQGQQYYLQAAYPPIDSPWVEAFLPQPYSEWPSPLPSQG